MKYVALDINGWLNGTVCRFLTKAEKSIWGDFIALGGDGEGRIGYIEEFKHVPYTRQALLTKTHCFTEEDIKAFDGCFKKCLEGVHIGDELDTARISIDEYGCIKIENWDTYQHSDYPQGYTEKEAKELKKAKSAERALHKIEPISQTIQDAKEKERVAKGVITQTQTVIDALKEKGIKAFDEYTGQILPTSRELKKDGG